MFKEDVPDTKKTTARNIIAAHINQVSGGTITPDFVNSSDQPLFKVSLPFYMIT